MQQSRRTQPCERDIHRPLRTLAGNAAARVLGFRCAIALLLVAAALPLAMFTEPQLPDSFLAFFLCAVILAAWIGRIAAGVVASLVSMVAVDYYFVAPINAFAMQVHELSYLVSFLGTAVAIGYGRRDAKVGERDQAAEFHQVFERAPEAMMLTDVRGYVFKINSSFVNMFGYVVEEVSDRLSIDLIVPAHLRSEALKARTMLTHGYDVELDTIRQRKDRSALPVVEISFPITAAGLCVGYCSVFRSAAAVPRLVETAQLGRELAEFERGASMRELVATIAHEVNQPIGAIAINAGVAKRWLRCDPPNAVDAEAALDSIVDDAHRAASVISRVRSAVNRRATPMVALDVNTIIDDVVQATSDVIHAQGVELRTGNDEALRPVVGDPLSIRQVLMNLVMNSLDSLSTVTDRPRFLAIAASNLDDGILVEVTDSGDGWDDRDMDCLFEPFFTTKETAVGLGLTTSRSIIEAHEGRLWAERRVPFGAIFRFSIPAARCWP